MIARLLRIAGVLAGLVLAWALLVEWAAPPPYLLPSPLRVARVFLERGGLIFDHTLVTLGEILLSALCGGVLGAGCALTLVGVPAARRWLLPLMVASQAAPVFALAPLLVLWLGYGLAAKVAAATLIVFFPVASVFYDGLRQIEPGWLDLARVMNAKRGRVLWLLRAPAALPALGAGLRAAAAVAPIGAVIGEWVGAGAGLGYLMLHANGRMQIDLMFAALLTLTAMAVGLYLLADAAARRLAPWAAPR